MCGRLRKQKEDKNAGTHISLNVNTGGMWVCRKLNKKGEMVKTKIVIRENGKTTYKEVADNDFLALQKEIEKNIRFHHFNKV